MAPRYLDRLSLKRLSFLLVVLAGLFGFNTGIQAATGDKLDPKLRLLFDHPGNADLAQGLSLVRGPAGDEVDVIILGRVDESFLQSHGARPGTVLSELATARVPLAALAGLANSPQVDEIRAAEPMTLMLDKNRIETEVTTEWGGTPPTYPKFSGLGVVVGIVDTGIDVLHADFRDSNNQTRIKYLWDQSIGTGPAPSGFGYGTEWTASQINSGLCTERDTDSHGSHMAGGAAGNGRATGNGKPAYTYVGMAPRADMVVVKAGVNGVIYDSHVIDAINYTFQKATALGKNAVVCVAMGKQSGPHDGTDPLDVAIDNLSSPGKIVVAPVGNEGTTKIHSQIQLGNNGSGLVSFSFPTYVVANPLLHIEGWCNSTSTYTVTVTSPGGVLASGSATNTGEGWVLISTSTTATGKKVLITLNQNGGPTIRAGEWKINVRATGTPTGPMDFWITDYYLGGFNKPVMVQGQTAARCIASPASANEAVGVGAYAVHTTWINLAGATMSHSGAVLNQIADFSSRGPRRDGVQKPDITASGLGIVSSLSSTAVGVSQTYIVQDGVHYMLKGTSNAASVTAGAVALLLQEFPGLDHTSVKNILKTRANIDTYTGSVPNTTWGWGKLNMSTATSGVDDPVTPSPIAARLTMGIPYPNPVHASTRLAIEMAEPSSHVRIGIYDVQGRMVRVLHDGALDQGSHLFTWDGLDTESRPVASGHYYLVATDQDKRQSRALTLVR